MKRDTVLSLIAVAALLVGCGNTTDPADDDDSAGPDATVGGSGADGSPAGGVDGGSGSPDADPSGDPDHLPDPSTYRYLCDLDPPAGAVAPALPTYSGGAGNCPDLFHFDGVDKQARNAIVSGGVERRFILVAPQDFVPGSEQLPIVVLWHHMGSDPDTFLKDGYLQTGVDSERFLAILPEAKGDLTFPIPGVEPEWPWMAGVTNARIEEELRFFDDMVACVAAEYGVNPYCISNGGVSAGGMWNAIVAARRSELLASTISVSGGIDGPSWGGDMGRPWDGASRALPALIVWGGDSDSCVTVDFQASSLALEAELAEGGSSIVECVHNCGHGVPPFEDGDGLLSAAPLWQYFLNHPYWLTAGNSPYKWSGIPDSFPDWCGVDAGSASARTGVCGTAACPL